MPNPEETPAPVAAPPASIYEKTAWLLMAAFLFFVLQFHLLAALIAGLFVHAIVHGIADRLHGKRLNHERAKVAALAIIASILILATAAVVLFVIGAIRGHFVDVSALLIKLAESVERSRGLFDQLGLGGWLPNAGLSSQEFAHALSARLREHAQEYKGAGIEAGLRAGEMAIHAVIGIVIGALAAFETRASGGPFSAALLGRMQRLAAAFETVVFAQLKISALNTVLTTIYLELGLRLFGVHLPLTKTLILATFLFGLLPVVGNLISNTIIVLISAGVSPAVAVASLVFLIVVHKLEYFVNAKILGHQIHAAAWELLAVIFACEAVFGMHGVILAPIAYAYAKRELLDRGLI